MPPFPQEQDPQNAPQQASPATEQPLMPQARAQQPPAGPGWESALPGIAQRYGVQEDLIRRVIKQESGGNPSALSPKGAMGLMQLMPVTAQRYGINPHDPVANLDAGTRELVRLLEKYQHYGKALAAYNAGEGVVDRLSGAGGFDRLPEETRNYVSSIMQGYQPPQQIPKTSEIERRGAGQQPFSEPVERGLLQVQKYAVEPFEKMAQAGGELGRQLFMAPFSQGGQTHDLSEEERAQQTQQAQQAHPIATGIASGLGQLAGSTLGDPRNWPFFGAAAARPILQRLISGGFGVQMGEGAYQQAKNLHQNWDVMNPNQRSEAITQLIAGLGMTGMAAHGAIKGPARAGRLESQLTPREQLAETPSTIQRPAPSVQVTAQAAPSVTQEGAERPATVAGISGAREVTGGSPATVVSAPIEQAGGGVTGRASIQHGQPQAPPQPQAEIQPTSRITSQTDAQWAADFEREMGHPPTAREWQVHEETYGRGPAEMQPYTPPNLQQKIGQARAAGLLPEQRQRPGVSPTGQERRSLEDITKEQMRVLPGQQTPGEQLEATMRQQSAGPERTTADEGRAIQAIMRDSALLEQFRNADRKTQDRMKVEAIRRLESAQRPTGLAQTPASTPTAAPREPVPGPRPTEAPTGAPGQPVRPISEPVRTGPAQQLVAPAAQPPAPKKPYAPLPAEERPFVRVRPKAGVPEPPVREPAPPVLPPTAPAERKVSEVQPGVPATPRPEKASAEQLAKWQETRRAEAAARDVSMKQEAPYKPKTEQAQRSEVGASLDRYLKPPGDYKGDRGVELIRAVEEAKKQAPEARQKLADEMSNRAQRAEALSKWGQAQLAKELSELETKSQLHAGGPGVVIDPETGEAKAQGWKRELSDPAQIEALNRIRGNVLKEVGDRRELSAEEEAQVRNWERLRDKLVSELRKRGGRTPERAMDQLNTLITNIQATRGIRYLAEKGPQVEVGPSGGLTELSGANREAWNRFMERSDKGHTRVPSYEDITTRIKYLDKEASYARSIAKQLGAETPAEAPKPAVTEAKPAPSVKEAPPPRATAPVEAKTQPTGAPKEAPLRGAGVPRPAMQEAIRRELSKPHVERPTAEVPKESTGLHSTARRGAEKPPRPAEAPKAAPAASRQKEITEAFNTGGTKALDEFTREELLRAKDWVGANTKAGIETALAAREGEASEAAKLVTPPKPLEKASQFTPVLKRPELPEHGFMGKGDVAIRDLSDLTGRIGRMKESEEKNGLIQRSNSAVTRLEDLNERIRLTSQNIKKMREEGETTRTYTRKTDGVKVTENLEQLEMRRMKLGQERDKLIDEDLAGLKTAVQALEKAPLPGAPKPTPTSTEPTKVPVYDPRQPVVSAETGKRVGYEAKQVGEKVVTPSPAPVEEGLQGQIEELQKQRQGLANLINAGYGDSRKAADFKKSIRRIETTLGFKAPAPIPGVKETLEAAGLLKAAKTREPKPPAEKAVYAPETVNPEEFDSNELMSFFQEGTVPGKAGGEEPIRERIPSKLMSALEVLHDRVPESPEKNALAAKVRGQIRQGDITPQQAAARYGTGLQALLRGQRALPHPEDSGTTLHDLLKTGKLSTPLIDRMLTPDATTGKTELTPTEQSYIAGPVLDALRKGTLTPKQAGERLNRALDVLTEGRKAAEKLTEGQKTRASKAFNDAVMIAKEGRLASPELKEGGFVGRPGGKGMEAARRIREERAKELQDAISENKPHKISKELDDFVRTLPAGTVDQRVKMAREAVKAAPSTGTDAGTTGGRIKQGFATIGANLRTIGDWYMHGEKTGIKLKDALAGNDDPKAGFKKALGRYSETYQLSAKDAHEMVANMRKAHPAEEIRDAIHLGMDVNFDKAALQQAAASTKLPERLRKAAMLAQNLSKEEMTTARQTGAFFDSMGEMMQKVGALRYMLESYVPHLVDGDSLPAQKFMQELRAGVFDTNFKYAKQRIHQTMLEGAEKGVKYNLGIDRALWDYQRRAVQAVSSRAFIKELGDVTQKDNRPALVPGYNSIQPIVPKEYSKYPAIKEILDANPRLRDQVSSAYMFKDNRGAKGPIADVSVLDALGIKYNEKHISENDKARMDVSDYKHVNHPDFKQTVFVGKGEDGKPIFYKADLYAHPAIYGDLKNIYEDSQFRQHKFTRAALAVTAASKRLLLKVLPSGFHYTQEGLHSVGHGVNPFKPGIWSGELSRASTEDPIVRRGLRSGLQLYDYDYSDAMEGIKGVRGFEKDFENHLFGKFVPGLKIETFKKQLNKNLETYSKHGYSEDRIYEMTAQQVNNAYGMQSRLFTGRTKFMQDLFRLTALAPDFLESRARFVGSAFRPGGRQQAYALMRLGLYMYGAARALNAATNDGDAKWNPKDAFTWHWGGHEFSMRSVITDAIFAATDLSHFLISRGALIPRAIFEEGEKAGTPKFIKGSHGAVEGIIRSVAPIVTQRPVMALYRQLYEKRYGPSVAWETFAGLLESIAGVRGREEQKTSPSRSRSGLPHLPRLRR